MFTYKASIRTSTVTVVLAVACVAPLTRGSTQTVVRPEAIREWLKDTAQLGAYDERIGVMADEPRAAVREDYLYLWLPPSVRTRVCVHITSHDGYYNAEGEYDLTNFRTASRVRVALTSKYLRILRRYRSDELPILAVVGPDCDNGTSSYILASWSATANPQAGVVLLSARALRTSIAASHSPGREVLCSRVQHMSTLKFDVRCPFATSSGARIQLYEVRRLDENGERPVDIPLRIISP